MSAASQLSLIVAMANNRAIGIGNRMPWHLPADFAWFKQTTLGHPLIMGRKTFESIGRALPGRRNIVVTRNPAFTAADIEVVHSLPEAADLTGGTRAFVIGGASLYAEALPLAAHLYVTEVNAEPDADTYFPPWRAAEWREVSRRHHAADANNRYAMDFVVWERKSAPQPAR